MELVTLILLLGLCVTRAAATCLPASNVVVTAMCVTGTTAGACPNTVGGSDAQCSGPGDIGPTGTSKFTSSVPCSEWRVGISKGNTIQIPNGFLEECSNGGNGGQQNCIWTTTGGWLTPCTISGTPVTNCWAVTPGTNYVEVTKLQPTCVEVSHVWARCTCGNPIPNLCDGKLPCGTNPNPCKYDECNPATGLCEAKDKDQGTDCDADSNICTVDKCDAGVCTFVNKKCVPDTACKVSTCDPTNGQCEQKPRECPALPSPDDQCNVPTCSVSAGAPDGYVCSQTPKANNPPCEKDGNPCTEDKCDAGVCKFVNNKNCVPDTACKVSTCNMGNGLCEQKPRACPALPSPDNKCNVPTCSVSTDAPDGYVCIKTPKPDLPSCFAPGCTFPLPGSPGLPANYELVQTSGYPTCEYYCRTKAKLNCPWFGPGFPFLGNPIVCGGTTKKVCPAISCAYTSSYTASGPNGCASAQTQIQALTVSASNFNFKPVLQGDLKRFCIDAPSDAKVVAAAEASALAYAEAVATTFYQYTIALCGCCSKCGNSIAYGAVAADVQAVAQAFASSLAGAIAAITDECGDNWGTNTLVAGAQGFAITAAKSVELAINTFWKKLYTTGGCTSDTNSQFKSVIARAVTCAFAEVYAAALDNMTPGVTYACGATLSLSGYAATNDPQVCQVYGVQCECTPAAYQYNNLGFEKGSFDGSPTFDANPVWSVGGDPSKAAVVPSAGPVVTGPKEGAYFAQLTTGCGSPTTISTTFSVPPCATTVSLDYVFACGDYLPFDDTGLAVITVKDAFTGDVVTATSVMPSCSATGDFMATNGGHWLTVTLPIAMGLYTVEVQGASTNTGDCLLDSALYIDNVKFA